LSVMVRLHPLETVYYNAFTGGLRGAYMNYDMDYWGNAYPEVIARLREYLTGRGEALPGRTWRVAPCGAPRALAAEVPREFVWVKEARQADFLLGLVGMGCEGMDRGVTALRVSRFGVPLAWVQDLRGTIPPRGPSRPNPRT
ncbi:MAG: hypothetical protein AAB368_11995, partial [bacterium]